MLNAVSPTGGELEELLISEMIPPIFHSHIEVFYVGKPTKSTLILVLILYTLMIFRRGKMLVYYC